MIRHIPITDCSDCPYRVRNYGKYECRKFNHEALPDLTPQNGITPPPPAWCPLPPHPSFIERAAAQEGGAA